MYLDFPGCQIIGADIHRVRQSLHQRGGVIDPRSLQEHRSPRDAMRGRNRESHFSEFPSALLKFLETRTRISVTGISSNPDALHNELARRY